MATHCEKCGQPPRFQTRRFCPRCETVVRREMRKSGYFQRNPPPYFNDQRGRKCKRTDPRVREAMIPRGD
jgi:uncharacterized Zn finger protein (UPF0148 family)